MKPRSESHAVSILPKKEHRGKSVFLKYAAFYSGARPPVPGAPYVILGEAKDLGRLIYATIMFTVPVLIIEVVQRTGLNNLILQNIFAGAVLLGCQEPHYFNLRRVSDEKFLIVLLAIVAIVILFSPWEAVQRKRTSDEGSAGGLEYTLPEEHDAYTIMVYERLRPETEGAMATSGIVEMVTAAFSKEDINVILQTGGTDQWQWILSPRQPGPLPGHR